MPPNDWTRVALVVVLYATLMLAGILCIVQIAKIACAEQIWCPPTYCSPEVECYGQCICVKSHPWNYAGRCFLPLEEDR